ncbi:hypothetical protein WJX79_007636 [Trebouxia sp. C0005]
MRVLQERNSASNALAGPTPRSTASKSNAPSIAGAEDQVNQDSPALSLAASRPDQSAVLPQMQSGTNTHTDQTHTIAHSMIQAAPTFGLQQVVELYRNTLKLASENKITKDNTWALGLIDHMSDLVKPSDEERGQTNFQRASCTLDAGVKIYSYRVDSVHNSIYKTLGGLSRTAGPSQQDGETEGGEGVDSESGPKRKRGAGADHVADPSATLEANVENLNVKKFDLTFAVDPLFHKTSAQFDEGGAKGLLLNNLSVYHGCEIVFDSSEVPEQAMAAATQVSDVQLDCSAWQRQIAEALGASPSTPITPSLAYLTALLGPRTAEEEEGYAREANELADQIPVGAAWTEGPHQEPATQSADITDMAADAANLSGNDHIFAAFEDFDESAASEGGGGGGDTFDDGGDDACDTAGWIDTASSPQQTFQTQGTSAAQTSEASQLPEGLQFMLQSSADSQEEGSRALSRWSMWAGASHWRYQQPAQRADPDSQAESQPARSKRRTKAQHVVDFENLPELPDNVFELAPHKDISLKAMPAVNTLLPPDHHYKLSMLSQLFTKPASATLVRGDFRDDAGPSSPGLDFGGASFEAADDGEGCDGFGDSGGWGNADYEDDGSLGDAGDLLEAPRKVEKISVTYSKASKQVDVKALKETLWHSMTPIQEGSNAQNVFRAVHADGHTQTRIKARFMLSEAVKCAHAAFLQGEGCCCRGYASPWDFSSLRFHTRPGGRMLLALLSERHAIWIDACQARQNAASGQASLVAAGLHRHDMLRNGASSPAKAMLEQPHLSTRPHCNIKNQLHVARNLPD